MKQIIPAFFLSLILFSCGGKTSRSGIPKKECIGLNDEGAKYLMQPSFGGSNETDTAITFFKQAISCDSNYIVAYLNLANAYDHKHDFKSEMLTYDKILLLTNNDPVLTLQKGILFEKLGEVDSAKSTYSLSAAGFQKRLSLSPDNFEALKGSVYLKALTVSKDAAIEELNGQIIAHPNIAGKLNSERFFFEDFDRKEITGRAVY